MNEFLAELYGTPENIGGGDDLEKNAAAEFLVKLAADEGVDLDTLSDDEVGELLAEIEQGEGSGEAEVEDETQEKMAEADFLGRAMAHAYVDELTEIEKEAGVKEWGSKGYGAVKSVLGKAKDLPGRYGKSVKERTGEARRMLREARTGKGSIGSGEMSKMDRLKALAGAGKKVAPELAAGGLAAGAAGYGGYKALGGGSEKRQFNENFESLAQERAYEMLAEAGYDVEKVAQADIDTTALQMLEQAGYEVQWNQ